MPAATVPAKRNLNQVIRERDVATVSDTLSFDDVAVQDLTATALSLDAIAEAIKKNRVETLYYIWVSVKERLDRNEWLLKRQWTPKRRSGVLTAVFYSLCVKLGEELMQRVKGPHVAYIDPRVSDCKENIITHAKYLLGLFLDRGYSWDDIIISIPATEAGIHAAAHLQKMDEMKVNLYLVSNLIHAAACVEAGVASICVPVQLVINASLRSDRKGVLQDLASQTGIDEIRSILAYFKVNQVNTDTIGTDFSKEMAEIGLLSDFDALCMTPEQIDRLRWSNIPIESPLDTDAASVVNLRASQAQFPTTYLKAGDQFMCSNMVSPRSRKMIYYVLDEGLEKLENTMIKIEYVINSELERQVNIFLDGELLYRPLNVNLEGWVGFKNSTRAEKQRPIKKEASFTTGFGSLQLTDDEEPEEVF